LERDQREREGGSRTQSESYFLLRSRAVARMPALGFLSLDPMAKSCDAFGDGSAGDEQKLAQKESPNMHPKGQPTSHRSIRRPLGFEWLCQGDHEMQVGPFQGRSCKGWFFETKIKAAARMIMLTPV
jgi:hypothetical protein